LVHTLILLFVGLPLGDYLVRPSSRADAHPALWRRYYLFENAKNNPRGYNAWQLAYVAHCGNLWRHIFMNGDATTTPPWRLRPGSSCPLFESRIVINQRGFRGPEIPADKGDAYRIVALGESTTFGLTIFADEKPWPELLEQMIRQRLKLRRPVQVINAGVPSYTLKMNLDRMARDVLPLKPDMILSYHGINGFVLMQDKGASAFANNPPEYRPRPLKLLADAEYRWKMFRFGRQARQAEWDPPAPSELVNTEYGRAYEELIRTAQTNGIRLVVANFSMAVNARSSRELQEFYRPLYPAVHWDIRANELHSVIVEQIARRHPEVGFVETRPKLDGEHDKFLDLVHFAPEGEQQMAETFFAGIRSILEKDIGCMEPQELAATRQAVIDTVPRPMSF
jgi:lysophospholipase L1-like esterase